MIAMRRNGLIKKGTTWHYRVRVAGILYQGSTRCTAMADAREVLAQVRKQIGLGLHGMPQAPSLGALIDAWCDLHRQQEAHVRCARWCQEALGPMTKLPVSSITTDRVEAWINRYQDGHKPTTINLVLRYLKLWCRWAVKRRIVPGLPYDVAMRPVQQLPRPVVKAEMLQAFLVGVDIELTKKDGTQVMAPPEVRAAVRMMIGLGLREAEVLGARWTWLDGNEYTVGKAKGMRPRTIGVPPWVLPSILALPRTVSGLIFPGHVHGWLRKALARGSRSVPELGRALGAHRMRASFATLHAAAGTPLPDLQAMMGHAHISTTMGYVEADLERQKASQDRLASMLKLG